MDQAQVAAAQPRAEVPVQSEPSPSDQAPPPSLVPDTVGQAESRPVAELKPAEQPAAPSTLPPALSARLGLASAYFRGVDLALTAAGTNLSDLVGLQVFPSNLDRSELLRASQRVDQAHGQPYDALTRDLQLLLSLMAFVVEHGSRLSLLFQVALRVAQSAHDPELRLTEAIMAIGRYVNVRVTSSRAETIAFGEMSFPFDLKPVWPSTTLESLEYWRALLAELRQRRIMPVSGEADRRAIWGLTAKNVRDHFIEARSYIDVVSYQHFVGAAAGVAPANVMRRDLRQMTAADWSRMCVAGFPTGTDVRAPLWCFVAGLRALGFNRKLLTAACGLSHDPGDDDRLDLCNELASSAPADGGDGYILVMRDDGPSVGDTVDFYHLTDRSVDPPLALTDRELNAYTKPIEWLHAHGALTRVIYEEDE